MPASDITAEPTRADTLSAVRSPSVTRTSAERAAEDVGHLRNQARFLLNDVGDLHGEAVDAQLEHATDTQARRAVSDLLEELGSLGMSWRAVARLVGVTVPALRKWRNGEEITGSNRRHLARVVAFVDILRAQHLIQEVGSWLEMPLGQSTTSAIDLYVEGFVTALLEYAAGHVSSVELLKLSGRDPVKRSGRFEVVTGDDGEPILRVHSQATPGEP